MNSLSSALSFVNYRGKFNSADAFGEHAGIIKIFAYGALAYAAGGFRENIAYEQNPLDSEKNRHMGLVEANSAPHARARAADFNTLNCNALTR